MNEDQHQPKPTEQERHKKHQEMLEEHRERKLVRRERHRSGWHRIKIAPISLI